MGSMGNPNTPDLAAFNAAVVARITKTLETRSLSVAWLAGTAAIARTTLDRVMADPLQLTLGQIGKITVALDVDHQWLLTGTPSLVAA